MLRLQTILQNERLWLAPRIDDTYGSFQHAERLPVSLPVSIIQEQFKSMRIPNNDLPDYNKPRSIISREDSNFIVDSFDQEDAKPLFEENIEPLVKENYESVAEYLTVLEDQSVEEISIEECELSLAQEPLPTESILIIENNSYPTQEDIYAKSIEDESYLTQESVQVQDILIEDKSDSVSEHVQIEPMLIEENESYTTQDHTQAESVLITKDETTAIQENLQVESVLITENELDSVQRHEQVKPMIITKDSSFISENVKTESTVIDLPEEIHSQFPVEQPNIIQSKAVTEPAVAISTMDESRSEKSVLFAEYESIMAPLNMNSYSTKLENSEEESEVSSASSFAPVTPTSIESPIETQLKSNTKSSLFRRETAKLYQKRRSLTLKLKSALSNSNKRNSM